MTLWRNTGDSTAGTREEAGLVRLALSALALFAVAGVPALIVAAHG